MRQRIYFCFNVHRSETPHALGANRLVAALHEALETARVSLAKLPSHTTDARRSRVAGRLARPTIDSSERLGKHRWVRERTFACLNQMKRLVIRSERRVDIHEALLTLGCSLICFHFLEPTFR